MDGKIVNVYNNSLLRGLRKISSTLIMVLCQGKVQFKDEFFLGITPRIY